MRRDETCGWRDSFFAVSLNEDFLRRQNRATVPILATKMGKNK